MNTKIKNEIEMKDIEGYEGEYAVTRDGQVYSYKLNKFLSPSEDGHGYLQVTLHKNGKQTAYLVHRLVAQAFIPNPKNKETVDHIDRNRLNNDVENLRWATYKEQAVNRDQEAVKQHLEEIRKIGVEKAVEKTRKKTAQIDINTGEIIQVFSGCREAARVLGDVSSGAISEACNGKRKTAYGFRWAYID